MIAVPGSRQAGTGRSTTFNPNRPGYIAPGIATAATGPTGAGAGYWQANRLVMALALIWLAHIALDRLLGTGLKYKAAGVERFVERVLG